MSERYQHTCVSLCVCGPHSGERERGRERGREREGERDREGERPHLCVWGGEGGGGCGVKVRRGADGLTRDGKVHELHHIQLRFRYTKKLRRKEMTALENK